MFAAHRRLNAIISFHDQPFAGRPDPTGNNTGTEAPAPEFLRLLQHQSGDPSITLDFDKAKSLVPPVSNSIADKDVQVQRFMQLAGKRYDPGKGFPAIRLSLHRPHDTQHPQPYEIRFYLPVHKPATVLFPHDNMAGTLTEAF